MDMMDQSSSLFNQDISHQTGWRVMDKRGGRRRARGPLRAHLTPDGNLYGCCIFKLATSTHWPCRVWPCGEKMILGVTNTVSKVMEASIQSFSVT